MKKHYHTLILLLLLVPIQSVGATELTTLPLVSSGNSSYELYIDIDSLIWTRGEEVLFTQGIRLISFGSGIYDFHEIELWISLSDGDTYDIVDNCDWTSESKLTFVGDTWECDWKTTLDSTAPDSFSIYVGSFFWEDVGWGDPSTDDGWTWIADVTAVSPAPPTVTSPVDIEYEEGSIGNQISWTATHTNPQTYTVTRDGVSVASAPWVSDEPVTVNIDGLDAGTYEYSILFEDKFGGQTSDITIVEVVDSVKPVISSPPDVTFTEGETGRKITWTASDIHPYVYEILKDGNKIDSNSWTNDADIGISLDGLTFGNYNYTIIVEDESGNQSVNSVMVSVLNDDGETADDEKTTDDGVSPALPVPSLPIFLGLTTLVILKKKFKIINR